MGAAEIRQRPGMYINGLGQAGLQHLAWECVGNAIDQHLARRVTELDVAIADDGWVTVRDDGPGIPIDLLPTGVTYIETALTRLHASATLDDHFPHIHISDGLVGIGLAAVSALSERLEVETTRAGQRWAIALERGAITEPLRSLGPTAIAGTSIRYRPDPTIFPTIDHDLAAMRERLQELAWMNPLLRTSWQAQRLPNREGLAAWVAALAGAPLDALVTVFSSHEDVIVDLAVGWCGTGAPQIRSFVNTVSSRTHGTHVDGMWRGIAAAVQRALSGVTTALSPGLVAVVHVQLHGPKYRNPDRDHLASPVAGVATEMAITKHLPAWIVRDRRLRELLTVRL